MKEMHDPFIPKCCQESRCQVHRVSMVLVAGSGRWLARKRVGRRLQRLPQGDLARLAVLKRISTG